MAISLNGLESLQCEFVVPSQTNPFQEISRWSNTNIDRPALIVTPRNEQDVQEAIRIARDNNLTIIAGGGGHGTFVPVGANNLYLEMIKFKTIQLDKEHGTVRVGGGVTSGELLKALAAEGYYTPLPNSNAVGVVGCVIGGGTTPLNGIHGWMADIVISFRLVTSEGNIVEVGPSASGIEANLFSALCGAGHGLGIITAITTSAYPISSLSMTDDKIWVRSLIFQESGIDAAAQAFLDVSVSQPSPAASTSLTFMRSPPGTPAAGMPVIILGRTYFGSEKEAEERSAVMFQKEVVTRALKENTEMMSMANLNDRFEPQNTHGGHKAIGSCRLKHLDVETIKASFERWRSATETYPDAQRSILSISSFDNTEHIRLGQTSINASKFLESRNRAFSAMAVVVCIKEVTMTAMMGFLDDTMAEFRKGDAGTPPRSFPNNLRFGMDLEEMFDQDKLVELRRVKQIWDADRIFWSPYEL